MSKSQESKQPAGSEVSSIAQDRVVMLETAAIPNIKRSFAASGMLEPSVVAASQVVIEAAERFQQPAATDASADSVKPVGSIDPDKSLDIDKIRRAIEDARNAA